MSGKDHTHDEREIQALIAHQQQAISAKDVGGIMKHYAADAVIFNVKPPFQIRSQKDWNRVWESSLFHFPRVFGVETRDLVIRAGGGLAVAHYLQRFTGIGQDQSWVRCTVVYRRDQDQWLIVHEHNSVPFDPETLKVVFEPQP